MDNSIWLLLAVLTALVLLGVLVIIFAWRNKEKRPPDYFNFFIMGIIWLGAGLPLKMYALSAMGFIFMIIGLTHKSKWKENRHDWSKLNDEEKKMRIFLIVVTSLLVIAGLVMFLLVKD